MNERDPSRAPSATTATTVHLSVIVPTLNESKNVDAVVEAILAQATAELDLEVLIADGGSSDGTAERIRAWQAKVPVRFIEGGGGRGLAGDVLIAAEQASSPIIVVMDADLSHPPTAIPELVAPIVTGTSDMVIGSRYAPGGLMPDWPLRRWMLSRIGGALAWPLADVSDPMSGFFAVHRSCLLAVDPSAAGFKIGLEIMAAGGRALRVSEVPITFSDRTRGASKIGLLQLAAFGRRLMVLAGGAVSMGSAARFAAVGAMGLGIDFIAFIALFTAGVSLAISHVASFVLATLFNYTLNSQWSFAATRGARPRPDWRQYGRFLTVCLMALFLRGGVLATAIDVWGWAPETAILLAIASATSVNYLGSAFFVFPPASSRVSGAVRWRVAALGVLAYVVLLRLVFSATLDLIPEEAYYWNYSQHLDFGYLDHPPMVAWLIWLGSKFAGDTEFAVRIGAFLSWSIAAFFCYQLTRNIYGKTAALVAVLLFCILPFFFATGLLMTPDAPLTAAWGGALYFLERALIGNRRTAWWGVGVCVGLGMLSKYTIALLAPATLLFILLDPGSRRWLWQPGPYVAALVATLFFSPVIVWNALNDWASFAFQSTGRLEASWDFSLHVLLGSILLLLTPVGIASVATQFFSRGNRSRQGIRWLADRRTAFIAIYTLVPLSIFVVFSLFHEVKLNWTGPLWLAVLPAIARSLAGESAASQVPTFNGAWRATIVIALLIYGAVFHYMALRVPDIGNLSLKMLPIAWEEFGEQVEKIETDLQSATGEEPLRVGMDRYYLSSEAAFYDPNKDGVENTAGRSLFGLESLMFQFWFTPAEARGRNIILLSLKPGGAIAISSLSDHFNRLGPIREQTLYKDGTKVGNFYYRIGYDYKPVSPQTLLKTPRAAQ